MGQDQVRPVVDLPAGVERAPGEVGQWGRRSRSGPQQLGSALVQGFGPGNGTGADPAQYTTTYGYDPAGNPTKVTDPLGGVTTTAYDALGKVVGRKDADGRTTSYGCDDLDQLTKVTAPDGAVTAYGHDKLGNLTERTDANGHVTAYGYDAVHRLTSVTDPLGRKTTYAYDLAGQISAATVGGSNYSYDHDASGNQVTTLKDGAVTNRIQWDPNAPLPILATEYDSAWAVKQSYRYDPLGQPTATKTGAGALFYYHHDTQGFPVDVTGSTGTLHQRWAYDSFGTRVLNTTTSGAPASTPSYTGARYETTTGHLDLHARQYDTATGRFTRSDPAARDRSTPYVSAYAYADNVPSVLTDPSGLTPADPDNDRVDSLGEALGIFGDAFVDVAKSPFVFLGDLEDAFTGENGGAGAFVDKYLPVRPAYRLYRAEYMLRQQGCDALADLYAETADELAQQLVLTGVGGLTGWRRTAVATERELQSGGSSFRRPRSEMDFELEWADHAYDAIRADAQLDRVAQTAASHGYSAADINQIYNHLYIESHQLDAGMLRFDANPRIARAWNASRTEIRIPAISICSRMNCTSRTGCVSTATRTIAAPIRQPWTSATPGTSMRPRRTV
ncbi:RHS repeat-associated core domain-containing protein [Streptomyces goshikiensis]|uniref:RHS repeat-associated core domain-containing protein n=1 Tax=Streptomyces goshikiensis TaxID=1942 RepID=UPI00332DFEF8